MSIPKQHHYLPEFYLQGFCDSNSLWVFDRISKEFRGKQRPHKIARKSYYYSYTDVNGNRNTDLENVLSFVEGNAKKTISKIEERFELAIKDKENLALFISLMKFRTPAFEKEAGEILDTVFKEVNKITFATKETTRDVLQQIREETGQSFDEEDIQLIMKAVGSQNYTLRLPRDHSLALMFQLAPEIAQLFLTLDWIILVSSPSTSFVTSDNPLFIHPPYDEVTKKMGLPGLAISGTQKYFPLTKRHCLVMFDKGNICSYADIPPEDVYHINQLLALNCERFLIADNETQLRSIVEESKIGTFLQQRKWQPRGAP